MMGEKMVNPQQLKADEGWNEHLEEDLVHNGNHIPTK
jgi:hypothetical protein